MIRCVGVLAIALGVAWAADRLLEPESDSRVLLRVISEQTRSALEQIARSPTLQTPSAPAQATADTTPIEEPQRPPEPSEPFTRPDTSSAPQPRPAPESEPAAQHTSAEATALQRMQPAAAAGLDEAAAPSIPTPLTHDEAEDVRRRLDRVMDIASGGRT